MTLEFGRPKTSVDAWLRIPGKTDSGNKIDGGPFEHAANLKGFIHEIIFRFAAGESSHLSLESRSAPMETEDVRFIQRLNSFYRDSDEATTINWGYIEYRRKNPWVAIVPSGDDGYCWWQITPLVPDTRLGNFRLYCIETNTKFSSENTITRFNKDSEFQIVFASDEEMKLLTTELSRFKD